MPGSRAVAAMVAVETWLRKEFPDGNVVRSYRPETDLADLPEGDGWTLFVCLDDVTTEVENHKGTRWTDIVTLTVAVAKRIEEITEPTPEVDDLIGFVENLRDTLRWTKQEQDGLVIVGAEHIPNRPIYVQEALETDDLFVGLVSLEVRIPGER